MSGGLFGQQNQVGLFNQQNKTGGLFANQTTGGGLFTGTVAPADGGQVGQFCSLS